MFPVVEGDTPHSVQKVVEEYWRSPADWKHLGDCREHSHIIQRWLRFDSALWSDSFDLGQCACVQLPETGLAEKEDRARRSRRWMVLLLLMGALLTANVAAGVKYNQPVGTKKVTMQQLFKIFGTHSSDVCHSLLFSLWLTAQSLSCSLQRKSSRYITQSLCVDINVWLHVAEIYDILFYSPSRNVMIYFHRIFNGVFVWSFFFFLLPCTTKMQHFKIC